jgi:ElaB/YqjD/DUF883 family membrane-anchored ribosome-binding protein
MRKISVVIALLALAACGKKDDEAGGKQGSAESSSAQGGTAKAVDPVTCPPGHAVQDGACVAVVTPEKVAVVAQQQSRIDELVTLLDQVEAVGAPVELMNGLRQLDPWKAYVAKNERLKVFDDVVASLDTAVKQLRTFKGDLGQASAGLGNLKGELDRMLADTGAAKRIEEVRARISSQIRTTVEPLGKQVTDTVQNALAPLTTRFTDAANMVTLGCAAMALGRAGEQSKALCAQATEAFAQGRQYLEDFKVRPAALFQEVTTKLETELAVLMDDQAKQLIDTAQATVNDALKLPPAGATGSAAAGSAAAGSGATRAP